MTKITFTWFQCALCPVEGDTYYLLTHEGNKIKVCKTCYDKLMKIENNAHYPIERKEFPV